MNRREAIEAMLRGETVRGRNSDGKELFFRFRDETGFESRDDVPWRPFSFNGFGTFELDPPPNPHPVGTWHWAGVEYERGRSVKRRSVHGHPYCHEFNSSHWDRRGFQGEDFTATDWEVVS